MTSARLKVDVKLGPLVVLVVFVVASGCGYRPSPGNGQQVCGQGPAKTCPSGYYCANQLCWLVGYDAGVEKVGSGGNGTGGQGGAGGTGGAIVVGTGGGNPGTGGVTPGTGGARFGTGASAAGALGPGVRVPEVRSALVGWVVVEAVAVALEQAARPATAGRWARAEPGRSLAAATQDARRL